MGQKSLTQKNLSQIEPNQKKPKDILAFPKKAQVQKKPISKKAYGQKEPLVAFVKPACCSLSLSSR